MKMNAYLIAQLFGDLDNLFIEYKPNYPHVAFVSEGVIYITYPMCVHNMGV